VNRTFKKYTIQAGGTPQPVVGTWLTATTAPTAADPEGEILTNFPVNDSSMFQPGDYAQFIKANLTAIELGRVQKVPDGTHITVRGIAQTRVGGAFGTGDFVALALPANKTYIQSTPGNTGLLFLGTIGLVKATFANVIETLQNIVGGTQPTDYSDARYYSADPVNIADLWIDGSTGDGYLPSYGVV